MRVNIIGGGLAGCALAYMIKREGGEPVIYEASEQKFVESFANDCGTYNPRYTAQWDENAKYFSLGFFEALRLFEEFGSENVDHVGCGTLQLMNNEKKARRYPKLKASWEWPDEDIRMVTPEEASEIAGVEVTSECMFLPKSGIVSPQKMCIQLANDVEFKLGQWVAADGAAALPGDVTVLACGTKVNFFEEARDLPINGVRGQVTYIKETEISAPIKTTIGYGGHISPSDNGLHYMGATFQPWLKHTDILPEDDQTNIRNMCERMPSLNGEYEVAMSRAGIRTAAKDHFPIVGQLSDKVYVSAAHGSHGFCSSLASAMILAKKIVKNEDILSEDVVNRISPQRFNK